MQDNLDIFSLISQNDIVNNNKLTLSILKIIGQCDVKHIMRLSIKKNNVIRLAAILAIMSVWTFITAVLVYTCIYMGTK